MRGSTNIKILSDEEQEGLRVACKVITKNKVERDMIVFIKTLAMIFRYKIFQNE